MVRAENVPPPACTTSWAQFQGRWYRPGPRGPGGLYHWGKHGDGQAVSPDNGWGPRYSTPTLFVGAVIGAGLNFIGINPRKALY